MTQMNLGNALFRLGERESGTARLEEAIAAYRLALEELTRDRDPLHWAMTQTSIGAALNSLDSNWAYMVMTALAWNLKAWAALRLPETGRWQEKYHAEKVWLLGLEFKAFVQVMVSIPCQLVRQARRVVFRVLNYQPHLTTFFRLAETLRC